MLDKITITDSAQKQIAKLSKQHDEHYVRLAVVSGGCNGFSKVWSFDTITNADDIKYQCFDSILLIDSISLEILQGSIIDYKHDLMGSFFTIEVPAATSSCGCGTSFSI